MENLKNQIKIIRLSKTESTNTYLKELAKNGAPEGTVVVAEEQTAGRGRGDKSFFSPKSSGLYMSMLLRPRMTLDESLLLTPAVAVALSRAIEKISQKKCGIKWVNDVYTDGKKLAGILTEVSYDFKKSMLNHIVIGVGVNVSQPCRDFPDDIRNTATYIGESDLREALLGEFIDEFSAIYSEFSNHGFIEEYRARSILIGNTVEVSGSESVVGVVIGIDDLCRLVIELPDKTKKVLSSGEVSTRIL